MGEPRITLGSWHSLEPHNVRVRVTLDIGTVNTRLAKGSGFSVAFPQVAPRQSASLPVTLVIEVRSLEADTHKRVLQQAQDTPDAAVPVWRQLLPLRGKIVSDKAYIKRSRNRSHQEAWGNVAEIVDEGRGWRFRVRSNRKGAVSVRWRPKHDLSFCFLATPMEDEESDAAPAGDNQNGSGRSQRRRAPHRYVVDVVQSPPGLVVQSIDIRVATEEEEEAFSDESAEPPVLPPDQIDVQMSELSAQPSSSPSGTSTEGSSSSSRTSGSGSASAPSSSTLPTRPRLASSGSMAPHEHASLMRQAAALAAAASTPGTRGSASSSSVGSMSDDSQHFQHVPLQFLPAQLSAQLTPLSAGSLSAAAAAAALQPLGVPLQKRKLGQMDQNPPAAPASSSSLPKKPRHIPEPRPSPDADDGSVPMWGDPSALDPSQFAASSAASAAAVAASRTRASPPSPDDEEMEELVSPSAATRVGTIPRIRTRDLQVRNMLIPGDNEYRSDSSIGSASAPNSNGGSPNDGKPSEG